MRSVTLSGLNLLSRDRETFTFTPTTVEVNYESIPWGCVHFVDVIEPGHVVITTTDADGVFQRTGYVEVELDGALLTEPTLVNLMRSFT